MRMSIGIVLGILATCGMGTAAAAETPPSPLTHAEAQQQITQIDARLRNPELSDLERYDLALRKARLRRQFQTPLVGSKGAQPPTPTTQPSQPARDEPLPSAMGYFNQVISQRERQVAQEPPDLTDAGKKMWAAQLNRQTDIALKSLAGKQVTIAGTVADVLMANGGYAVLLTHPAGSRQLSRSEQDRIAECRRLILDHKRVVDAAGKRGENGAVDTAIARIIAWKDEIARIQSVSRDRRPLHQVTVLTSDPKALELRKGWTLFTSATIASAKLVAVQNGDAQQHYVVATFTADRLGETTQPTEAPESPDNAATP